MAFYSKGLGWCVANNVWQNEETDRGGQTQQRLIEDRRLAEFLHGILSRFDYNRRIDSRFNFGSLGRI